MDGMLTTVVGEVDTLQGPQPYTMRDRQVAHIRAMVEARRAAAEPELAQRRLRRDVVAVLHADGRLSDEQRDAGNEILRCFTALTSAVAVRTNSAYWERMPRGAGWDDLPPSLKAAITERYNPWCAWAGMQEATKRASLRDLVLLAVVDNLGHQQLADRLGMDRRRALRLLQEGLHGYARLAGWVKGPSQGRNDSA